MFTRGSKRKLRSNEGVSRKKAKMNDEFVYYRLSTNYVSVASNSSSKDYKTGNTGNGSKAKRLTPVKNKNRAKTTDSKALKSVKVKTADLKKASLTKTSDANEKHVRRKKAIDSDNAPDYFIEEKERKSQPKAKVKGQYSPKPSASDSKNLKERSAKVKKSNQPSNDKKLTEKKKVVTANTKPSKAPKAKGNNLPETAPTEAKVVESKPKKFRKPKQLASTSGSEQSSSLVVEVASKTYSRVYDDPNWLGNEDDTGSVGSGILEEDYCFECGIPTMQNLTQNDVILCDVCDGEYHLKCVGLTAVPETDFMCNKCLREQECQTELVFNVDGAFRVSLLLSPY
jgi:hypothetical protein